MAKPPATAMASCAWQASGGSIREAWRKFGEHELDEFCLVTRRGRGVLLHLALASLPHAPVVNMSHLCCT
ncbi:MAG: hypothetical protein J1D88_04910 [Treponema sp.]|nr:hypothetical protein [Treponema sp.]